MKTTSLLLIASLLLACNGNNDSSNNGNNDNSNNDAPAPQAPTPTSGNTKPTLGTVIDRQGRPAVNTALSGTFDTDATRAGEQKNRYNLAAQAAWPSFTGELKKNLAVYDALDRTCGNQLLAATPLSADRYNALAGVLANDQLYVNTASSNCTQYLAVEGNFIGGDLANADCGGRTPGYDVIDVTYSVLAAGALEGVSDGVAADGDGQIHTATQFPFLQ